MTSNGPTSVKSDRVGAVRRLSNRKFREKVGRFLVEGPQAVREAVVHHPELVDEVFVVDGVDFPAHGVKVTTVPEPVLLAMTETVHPQGVAAVCRFLPFEPRVDPRLIVVLHDVRDPGNAGTILRTADAAGADAVYFTGDSVDPYNGKCVRSTAGSLFHVPFTTCAFDEVPVAGLQVLATSGAGEQDLRGVDLRQPTAWVFGNEAHGLPDMGLPTVSIPIFGAAESLNLASAAAVCLYATAMAQNP
ncbi:MAG: RNA methyltransferase [Actinobacteria bacterium]|nr:RNA methyltransferase [Actinomycetota bacterium]MCB8996306.1 RNA methyltransferase [Actinomycetota bacterium]MCB9425170.1 RNA methyltransferase [Actinomycetota bacterium]HRY09310.1 RNA methyltransferase [Candidatus Nanopelagicales bacterium]